MFRHLVLGSGILLAAAVGLAAPGCSSTSSSTTEDGGPSCKLGGSCSPTQVCSGGIAGCTSNCECLGGTWQAPCPVDAPASGGACTSEGAYCGYSNQPNPCGASNCHCQGGAWSCGPTCVFDASATEAEASGSAACVAAGGQCVQGVASCGNVGPGATPGSCLDAGPAMLCCAVNADAGCSTEIQASQYDQTCTSDSDCVAVSVGDPCEECVFACKENVGAISASAMPKYAADVAKTPAGVAACGCPSEQPHRLCCRNGQCHADSECVSLDGSADGADAGSE